MATTTSVQRVTLRHPLWIVGLITIVLSLVIVAFDLGELARCGGGEGICFDYATHPAGVGALVLFFVLFVVGVVMLLYTSGATTVTSTTTPPPSPPSTPAPAAPAPASVTVNANPAPPPPTTTVNINPPRGTS